MAQDFDGWWSSFGRRTETASHEEEQWAKAAWLAGRVELEKEVSKSGACTVGLVPGRCVLQEWAWSLPLMQQTVLICALRGPDGVPKDTPAKTITRQLRRAILHDARPDGDNSFMASDAGALAFRDLLDEFFADTDRYPAHFLLHLYHAAEILGYKHPDAITRGRWGLLYTYACNAFHMRVELEADLDARLDR